MSATLPTTAADGAEQASLDRAAAEYELIRPRLLATARRILGSRAEAEDVVQDAWIRWQTYDRGVVANASAFLVTTTARLALNVAQSARRRHERHGEGALAELPGRPGRAGLADPAVRAEADEALERAVGVLLGHLNPTERAAYVLREGFEYGYDQIADMLQTTPTNARQLVSRAGRHLAEPRRAGPGPMHHPRLLRVLRAAARAGEMTGLERLLTTEAQRPLAVAC